MEDVMLVTRLPNELVEQILETSCLTAKDIYNFGATCTKFWSLVSKNNKLWKNKFYQLWPQLRHSTNWHNIVDWENEFKTGLHFSWKVRRLMLQLPVKFGSEDDITHEQLIEFWALMEQHPNAYYFMISALMMMLDDQNINKDPILKSYAEKVTRMVRQAHLTVKLKRFFSLPAERQILERGATMVAQWCQPLSEVHYHSIATQLNAIAVRACEALKEVHPSHPIFSTPPGELNIFRECNIPDNLWKPEQSQEVLCAVSRVLFEDMEFRGNNKVYYPAENSYIDKVLMLRDGIPMTLSIIFESVARRMGVRCEPVSFVDHFLLFWKDQYRTDSSSSDGSTVYYLDVLNGGKFLTPCSCPSDSPDGPEPMDGVALPSATAQQVVEHLLNNLEIAERRRIRMQSILEILQSVHPCEINSFIALVQTLILNNVNQDDLMETMDAVRDCCDLFEPATDEEEENDDEEVIVIIE